MSENIRTFDLGDVLSVTTGKLVSPTKIRGVYEILNYMTGDNLFTHQLPRASRECEPELLRQHPQLRNVDSSGVHDPATAKAFLAEQKKRFGERLSVLPLPLGEHLTIDPLQELSAMVGEEKIVVVEVPTDRRGGIRRWGNGSDERKNREAGGSARVGAVRCIVDRSSHRERRARNAAIQG